MIFPDPDAQRHLMARDDFLRSISDGVTRRAYANIISPLVPLRQRISATWMAPDGLPEVRFIKNAEANETELRDLVNTICLADGLLERCLKAQFKAEASLPVRHLPRALGAFSVAKVSLMWVYAHEVFHFIRRHALVAKHFGNDQATKHALEYDADLCAAAAIYRFLQYFGGRASEIECKKRVLNHLYWFLRSEVDFGAAAPYWGTETHQHFSARFNAITLKLAIMHNGGPADPHLMRPESRDHHRVLWDLNIKLERMYLGGESLDNEMIGRSPLISFAMANCNSQFTSPFHKRWDEISHFIESFAAISRAHLDNEASVAVFGDRVSLPVNG